MKLSEVSVKVINRNIKTRLLWLTGWAVGFIVLPALVASHTLSLDWSTTNLIQTIVGLIGLVLIWLALVLAKNNK